MRARVGRPDQAPAYTAEYKIQKATPSCVSLFSSLSPHRPRCRRSSESIDNLLLGNVDDVRVVNVDGHIGQSPSQSTHEQAPMHSQILE
jgi:hypothetical protein